MNIFVFDAFEILFRMSEYQGFRRVLFNVNFICCLIIIKFKYLLMYITVKIHLGIINYYVIVAWSYYTQCYGYETIGINII